MKYIIERVSDRYDKPCEEARRKKLETKINASIEKRWYWVIEINTLEELHNFMEKYGALIIENYHPVHQIVDKNYRFITIYDDYIEWGEIMKHLFLTNDSNVFMVYYQPKKKAQMLDFIYQKQKHYNLDEKEKSGLLKYIVKELQSNGYKVVEITSEVQNTININYDFDEESFVYRGVKIVQSQYGYSFYLNNSAKSFVSVLTIEEAIELIDKENK